VFRDVFQKGITFKDRWNYLFGPPGWSHDGSRLTSEQMREKEAGVEGVLPDDTLPENVAVAS
jgi:hypothetical protein